MSKTFQILDCRFGKEIVTNGGFVAEEFNSYSILPPQSIYRNQVIFSNSGMYWKQPNGSVLLEKKPNMLKAHKYTFFFIFISVNALLLWLTIRTMSKKS
jgi:hypothetical protein